ncbi:hypothetical protein TRIUR3_33105 [Triticum urartu]|uniref:GDP-fucose pyrophosphorylase domain-containing protein n=1 Tax=Triticum urartu TaxID=4572 RepID=M7Z1G2_TRIUA|nr:hypothetical protein TRIUR3_33105 [Triticum urartu]
MRGAARSSGVAEEGDAAIVSSDATEHCRGPPATKEEIAEFLPETTGSSADDVPLASVVRLMATKNMLLLHTSGDIKRVPWANPMGKAFLPVPYLAGDNPDGPVPLLFDHIRGIQRKASIQDRHRQVDGKVVKAQIWDTAGSSYPRLFGSRDCQSCTLFHNFDFCSGYTQTVFQVVETMDGTIVVASAFCGHQEVMLLFLDHPNNHAALDANGHHDSVMHRDNMLNVVHATVYESSVRADYQALFNAVGGVTKCLNQQQKNQFDVWMLHAVVANDLCTDDSFLYVLLYMCYCEFR